MFHFITTAVYQPFLNILVLFYWAIGKTPIGFDMGIAVILLTLFIRFLLLPVTLASHRSEEERRRIHQEVEEIETKYSAHPVERKEKVKKVLRDNPRILLAEGFMFVIQLVIALILWRIFATGLSGEDLHLLYPWMPEVPQPFHLDFLNRFDLTHPDLFLNVVQTFVIFLLETVAILTSPYPVTRQEVIRVQVILPLVSFAIFAFLPAGKKLFVITTLLFSLVIIILQVVYRTFKKLFPDPEPEEEHPQYYPYPPYPYPPYPYPYPPKPSEEGTENDASHS